VAAAIPEYRVEHLEQGRNLVGVLDLVLDVERGVHEAEGRFDDRAHRVRHVARHDGRPEEIERLESVRQPRRRDQIRRGRGAPLAGLRIDGERALPVGARVDPTRAEHDVAFLVAPRQVYAGRQLLQALLHQLGREPHGAGRRIDALARLAQQRLGRPGTELHADIPEQLERRVLDPLDRPTVQNAQRRPHDSSPR
jgi:hypothetical protein